MQPGMDDLDAGLHARPGPVVGDGAHDAAEPQRPDGPELVVDDPLPRRLQRALLLRHLAGKLRHEPSRAPQSRCLRLRVRSLLDCYGGRRGERGVGINSGERGGAEGNGIGRLEEPYGAGSR